MNPLLLHLDRLLGLYNRGILSEEKQLLVFLLGGAIFTSLFMKEDKNRMGFFFDLLAFAVKNEPHHS